MNEEEKAKQYIDKQQEWQRNQYSPGHWTGGRIPPYLMYKNKKLGIAFLIIGLIWLTWTILAYSIHAVVPSIVCSAGTVLFFLASYRKFKG